MYYSTYLLIAICFIAKAESICSGSTGQKTFFMTTSDGLLRSYDIFFPSAWSGSAEGSIPLVFNTHGLGAMPIDQELLSLMNPFAEDNGFIVVYPQGFGNSFNGDYCCGLAHIAQVDDVSFLREVTNYLVNNYCVDRTRVYATGMSNGGVFSYALHCNATDFIAAVAPVAGTLKFPVWLDYTNSSKLCKQNPPFPMPTISFQGNIDVVVLPYLGRYTFHSLLVQHNCSDHTGVETYRKGGTYCTSYTTSNSGCAVLPSNRSFGSEFNATYCIANLVTHTWPGTFIFGGGNDISANKEMWNFFKRYRLP